MKAIFLVTAGALSAVVRAPCLSCARQLAAEQAPAEQFQQWVHGKVTLLTTDKYPKQGKTEILEWRV